jgi:hypothetical protein
MAYSLPSAAGDSTVSPISRLKAGRAQNQRFAPSMLTANDPTIGERE